MLQKKKKDEKMANKSRTNNNFNVKPMIAEKKDSIEVNDMA